MQTILKKEDPTDKLSQKIEEKLKANEQLTCAINDYISLKLSYKQKSNELLLTTNFKEVLDESRPTVAMKEAWIENQLFDLKMEMEMAKENVKIITRDIELLDDYIKLYELKTRMELKE